MEITGKILIKTREYRDYTAQTLAKMVKIPSLSGEEKKVISQIKKILKKAGVDNCWVDGFGNLIARVGKGPKKLAIDAHIDTVDTGDPDQWEYKPFAGLIKDGYVHGRGTVDQERGAASMITAARILQELGYDDQYSIYFTFTIMEEDCDGLCWEYLITEEQL